MKKLLLIALWSTCALACKVTSPMTVAAIEQRLQPVGVAEVDVTDAPVKSAAAADDNLSVGERVYNQSCMVCHAAGVAGAPKLGDKAAWAPRIAKGMETLLTHAINGFNAMPARGTCMSCSDAELEESIKWMIERSR